MRRCLRVIRWRANCVLVLDALSRNTTFFSAALPQRIYPPLFNRYAGGQSFGFHVDNAIRYDRSLRWRRLDPYRRVRNAVPQRAGGVRRGRTRVEDTYGEQRVKLQAGDMVLYPGTSRHKVTPVTRGERIASFFWIQSLLREDAQRRLMFDLDTSIRRLTRDVPEHPSLPQLTGIYHNLLRRWAAT